MEKSVGMPVLMCHFLNRLRGRIFIDIYSSILRSVGEHSSPNLPDYTLEWTVLLRDAAGIIPSITRIQSFACPR